MLYSNIIATLVCCSSISNKTSSHFPLAHPFVERLIGSIRESYSTTHSSGRRQTWRTSCEIIKPITTRIELNLGWMGLLQ